jgi:hypothetical protein
VIYDQWKKHLNSKPKERNASFEDIYYFARTDSLEAAAGYLLEKGLNLGSFEILQNIFRKDAENCKQVLAKLLMIRHKEYKGHQFKFDFKIRKKYSRQLYKKYEKVYKYDDWKDLWFREKTCKKPSNNNKSKSKSK